VPPSLRETVRGHAARSPEAPWLFWPRGPWDWAWLSWAEGVRRLEAGFDPESELSPPEAFLRALAQTTGTTPEVATGSQREILVAHRPWEDPDGRSLLAWAVAARAAILFAPHPESYVASAAWARPTLFQGTATEIAALRQAAEAYRPPWPRRRGRGLPFGRLHTVWKIGEEDVDGAEREWWEGRGVRVVG
jgi:hypothetical protein